MMPPRNGEDVMQAIKDGDRQGFETILHGLTKKQVQHILHYTYRWKPNELLTPLLATIKFRRIYMMKYILHTYQVDVEQRGVVFIEYSDKYHLYEKFIASNVTPVWYAAAKDLLEYVQVLVEIFRADVNAVSDSNTSALHMACVLGNRNIMAMLLKHGADPNTKSLNDDLTPLLCLLPLGLTLKFSSITYHMKLEDIPEKVKLLLKHGADINARSKTGGFTFLHSVAEMGDVELYQYLREQRAEYTEDNYSQTPFHCACLAGKEELYEYMCSLPDTSENDCLTGLELIYVNMLNESPMDASMKLVDIQDMREEMGDNWHKQDSSNIIWLDDDKPCQETSESTSIWQEGLLICARHFGTESIHFALRLFLFTSHYDSWEDLERTFMLKSALEMICLKHKVASTFLPVFLTLQTMRHAEFSGQCYQHNLAAMLKVIQMCVSVLQNAYHNPTPMISGRTINLIEVANIYKAAQDALHLVVAHRADIHCHEFKSQVENLVRIGDQLVQVHMAEYSYFHWLLDQPRTDYATYKPAKFFDVVFYVLQCHPDVNVYNFRGDTALHLLAKYNKPYTDSEFSVMLKKFESSNLHYDLVDANGDTAADICVKYSPERVHFFMAAASSYISLKCLAAKVIQRCVPMYCDYLPKQLEIFVSMH